MLFLVQSKWYYLCEVGNLMKIFLIDINKEMCDAWEKYFSKFIDVTIVNEDIARYEDLHSIECITFPLILMV